MRWVKYAVAGNEHYGILEGDQILEVSGDPLAGYQRTQTRRPFRSVKLLPPVMPRTFYCAGLNYAEHVIAAANKRGEVPKLPKAADIGYRANNALIAHGDPIVIPADAGERVQYEGELVAVIGRQAKGLTEANALDCVLGWSIGNDVSERDWQSEDRTLWRAKNADTFKPMGPWIETDLDLDKAVTKVRVNGKTMIEFKTNSMLFGVAHFLARMSKYLTLYPGDVVWMGTEGHTENIKHGDTCEIEITGIGTLSNPVVREGR
jgi:2-keto-4-pentenoate hydratase/2-oxohepta-3-ene-1,7-dioic acid hydratase in catechol pathway